jgi:hypothetical protein
MEYPTLITTGGNWYLPYLGVRGIEIVTVHELGHQWFYGMVASNEHTWPFLDEGLTSYAESAVLESSYGAGSLIDNWLIEVALPSGVRVLANKGGQDDIVAKAAPDFASFQSLGAHVYNRTATILDTAGRVYGRSKLDTALGRYARYYRYRHPGPEHLFGALEETLGRSASDNLRRAVFERGTVDYLMRQVQSVQDAERGEAAKPWLSRVVVARHGELVFPVKVRLFFEDGSSVDKPYSGRTPSQALTHTGSSKLTGATIDPDRHVRLDSNLLNNSLREDGDQAPRVWERCLYYLQLLFSVFGP